MLTENYHTHTYRCHHATGDVADYCAEAVAQGLTTLGFSDHVPYPKEVQEDWHHWAMSVEEIPGYFAAIDEARKEFPQLKIYRGFECEYNPQLMDYYKEEIVGKWRPDYLILGNHYVMMDGKALSPRKACVSKEGITLWTDWLLAGMHSELFQLVAHPDMFMQTPMPWNALCEECARRILAASEELQIPLEVNAYGLRKPWMDDGTTVRPMYPHSAFWKLAQEYDIPIVISSDAHTPADVHGNMEDALTFLLNNNPTSHVISLSSLLG